MRRTRRNRGLLSTTALAGLAGIVLFHSPPDTLADNIAITSATVEPVKPKDRSPGMGTVSSLDDLASRFRSEQAKWLPVMFPDSGFTLRQPCGMVVFDPKDFPDTFTSGLVGGEEHGCPVYTLVIAEDPDTREIVLANAEGKEIAAVKPETGYDPYGFMEAQYPGLYSGLYSAGEVKELQAMNDPSRLQITLDLLPADYADAYSQAVAEEQAKAATSMSKAGGMAPMMMYQGPALTNLLLSAIEKMANGMKLTLAYPWDFTNRVDFFTCPDLVGNWWNLAVDATNVNTSTNWIEWTDTATTAQTFRCYAAGNADLDSDGDGISDAREKYLYHTCPTNNDTDGDGLSDYYEIFVLNTDPNNAKTNKPIVWISYPANESRKVWLP